MIRPGSVVRDSYLMGRQTIGRHCLIEHAIIDNNVIIGDEVQLINAERVKNFESDLIHVCDGVIVIPAGARIPNGFVF